MNKVEILQKIANEEHIPNGYGQALLELQAEGYIEGLMIKESRQNANRKVMTAVYVPGLTEITSKGLIFIKENK